MPTNNPTGKSTDIIPENEFLALSKQNWVDLLLQTYKIFHLTIEKNVIKKQMSCPSQILPPDACKSMEMIISTQYSEFANSLYHPVENMLLFWLENVYNNNK